MHGQCAAGQLIFQGADNGILPNNVLKGVRTPFTVKCCIDKGSPAFPALFNITTSLYHKDKINVNQKKNKP
jgi:hypothetical protein